MRPPYLWTPDGERIVYEGNGSLDWVLADGASSPERIGPPGHFHPHAWTPDSDLIAVSLSGAGGDLVVLSPQSDAEPRATVRTPADEGLAAALSPDGQWLAYTSDATGQQEIWVRPYPGPGAPLRVSPRGGWEPAWARDGRTLFYLEGRAMMTVAVDTSAGFDFGVPVPLFDGHIPIGGQPPSYDVAADGRFVTTGAGAIPPVSVILDWPEMLRARAATTRPGFDPGMSRALGVPIRGTPRGLLLGGCRGHKDSARRAGRRRPEVSMASGYDSIWSADVVSGERWAHDRAGRVPPL